MKMTWVFMRNESMRRFHEVQEWDSNTILKGWYYFPFSEGF